MDKVSKERVGVEVDKMLSGEGVCARELGNDLSRAHRRISCPQCISVAQPRLNRRSDLRP